jgi:serine/threonine protein kinase
VEPPSNPTVISFDHAARTFEVVAGHVEAFAAVWQTGQEEPRLDAFLPEQPPVLRRMVLVELVKADLEYRYSQRHSPRRVEEYLAEFPELGAEGVPCALLYQEFHVRRQAGEDVTVREFFDRFPKEASELARLLGGQPPRQSLALQKRQVPGHVAAGQQLDDFDLLLDLGKGAFATVFLARQRSMQRTVALKVSAAEGEEPQTLAQLDHPHIVRVFDQRRLTARNLQLLYMQYVPGGTLQGVIECLRRTPVGQRSGKTLLEAVDHELNRRGETPPDESSLRERLIELSWPEVVCWMGVGLAAALHAAHQKGVLHRDVKPANVLLTAEGSPKLADFNVSFSSKLEGASAAAFFGGSLVYMSPEQIEASDPAHPREPDSLDGRSDLYSLAVVLWELHTGKRPFVDDLSSSNWSSSLQQMWVRRQLGPRPAEDEAPATVCRSGLESVLRTGLAPEPERRHASGAALARELELCLHSRAWQLLNPPSYGWQQLVCRWPVVALLLAALIPNVLAAVFNFVYNRREIVDPLMVADQAFWYVQLTINSIAFPAGMAISAWLVWPLRIGLRSVAGGRTVPGEQMKFLRRRCLSLGPLAGTISIVCWALAGLAYPLGMRSQLAAMPTAAMVHFAGSLVLCGLIAGAYPFFCVTLFVVRAWYPRLVRQNLTAGRDDVRLARLDRLVGIYLVLAGSVPMLAMLALALTESQNHFALVVLSASGLAGFAATFWLSRVITADLDALAFALAPPRSGAALPGDAYHSSWRNNPQG